MMSHIVICSE